VKYQITANEINTVMTEVTIIDTPLPFRSVNDKRRTGIESRGLRLYDIEAASSLSRKCFTAPPQPSDRYSGFQDRCPFSPTPARWETHTPGRFNGGVSVCLGGVAFSRS
jgi:hypothetical protein